MKRLVAHTHTHISCLTHFLVCCVCVVIMCSLMFINISSCMLVWLLIALSIALSCITLEFLHCKGRCSEQRPQDLMQKWSFKCIRSDAFWCGAVQSAVRIAPLCFPERTELGRYTGAVQRRSTYSAQGKNRCHFSKRPHFGLTPYIYATLTLGQ